MNTSQRGIATQLRTRGRGLWIRWVVWAALGWGCAGGAAIAQQTAQCQLRGTFTGASSGTAFANSTSQPNCNSFALTWNIGDPATSITALSIQLEGSDDGASWTAYTGASTVIVGTNPSTALSGAIKVTPSSKLAFVRVKVTSFTGSGTISYQLYGYSGTSAGVGGSAGGGGSCGALAGDVTGTCGANTVVKVNGGAIPVSQPNLASNSSGQIFAGSNTGVGSVVVLNNGPLISSPILTGVPTAPTAAPGTNTTQLATTAFVQTASTGAVTSVSGASPITSTGGTTPTIGCATCLINNGVNTGTAAFTLDASAATSANADKVPVIAGAAPSQNGAIAYNSTDNNLHGAKSAADAVILQSTATSAGNGNCANWINSGGSLKIGDAGAPCGSGGGSGGGVLTYSGPTLSILSGTAFCPVGGGGACSATETNVDIDSAAVSTVSNMYVQLSTSLGAGNSVAITWRKNASSQTVTCTISGASATACNDTTHSFAVAQADLLDYQLVFTGTIVVTPTILIMSQFGTVNAGVTSVSATAPITSTGGTTPNISATYQGNGAKIQASTGSTTTNDCVKFDANGNTVDAGAACGAGSVTNVTATAPLTSTGGTTPVISATYQGNGSKIQASTGSTTTNDCVKFDANGNTVDSGAVCGTGVTSVGGLTGVVPGGWVFLEGHTAAAASELDFTVCPANTAYDQYAVTMTNITVGTNAANVSMQISSNGGSTYDTATNYRYGMIRNDIENSPTSAVSGCSSCAGIAILAAPDVSGILNTATPGLVFTGYLYGLNVSAAGSFIFHGQGMSWLSVNSVPYNFTETGMYKNAASINAFRFIASAGNFSGTVRCYGIAKQ